MLKVLKYAKKHWYIMLVIMLLLVVQITCELELPDYTSDIVDVGIQNQGVKYPVPEQVSESTYENIKLFLDENDVEKLDSFYKKSAELYTISIDELAPEDFEELKEIILPAELATYMFTAESEETKQMQEQIRQGLIASMGQMGTMPESIQQSLAALPLIEIMQKMPQEARIQMSSEMTKQFANYPDYMIEAMGIRFVAQEYQEIGIDMEEHQMDYMKKMGAQMLGLAILIMSISIVVGFLSSRLAAYTAMDVRSKVFHKVMDFSNAEMNQFSTSSLITRCTNDVQQIQMVLTITFRIVLFAPIMGIGAIIKVVNTTTSMLWIIVLAVAAVFMIIMVLMVVAMPKFKIMQKLVDGLNLVSREILTGLSVIRAFGREKHEEERFETASRNLMKTQLFTSRTMALMMPTMMFVMNGISVLIIWAGAHNIDQGAIQVGDMIAFITYTMQIVMSFLMISMVAIMLPRATVAAERIDEVLNSKTLIINKDQIVELPEDAKGTIAFADVSFSYPNAKESALKNISFTANAGQTTAIIGSTGCGKSTLVHLIPRLFDVTEGSITIDGVDIRDMEMKKLRQMIGFVPQKGTLFSGTIESNIKFGNREATKELMEEAAEIAQATEFISEKKEGFASDIAQGGSNVSGGQKQRLAIARAIAKQPKIYVFDDSFSALDYKTDTKLRKALHEKVGDSTVIIVAQRISTILHADKILVLEDGEIVGQGTHAELMQNNEVYQQIAASQLSQKDIEAMKGGLA